MRFSTGSIKSSRSRSSSGRDEKLEGLRLFKARASFQTALLRARVSRAAHRLAHPLDVLHHDHEREHARVNPPTLPAPSESMILHTIPHRDSLTVISRRRRGEYIPRQRSWVEVGSRSQPTTDEEYGVMARELRAEISLAMARWEEMARIRTERQVSGGSDMSGETLVGSVC